MRIWGVFEGKGREKVTSVTLLELRYFFGTKKNSDDILADFGQPLLEFRTNTKRDLVNIRHIHPS